MLPLGCESCHAGPGVWVKPEEKANGGTAWPFTLLYTGGILCISNRGEEIIRKGMSKFFKLKEASAGSPGTYLGGKLRQAEAEPGILAWAFSSSKYAQEAAKNADAELKKRLSSQRGHALATAH